MKRNPYFIVNVQYIYGLDYHSSLVMGFGTHLASS